MIHLPSSANTGSLVGGNEPRSLHSPEFPHLDCGRAHGLAVLNGYGGHVARRAVRGRLQVLQAHLQFHRMTRSARLLQLSDVLLEFAAEAVFPDKWPEPRIIGQQRQASVRIPSRSGGAKGFDHTLDGAPVLGRQRCNRSGGERGYLRLRVCPLPEIHGTNSPRGVLRQMVEVRLGPLMLVRGGIDLILKRTFRDLIVMFSLPLAKSVLEMKRSPRKSGATSRTVPGPSPSRIVFEGRRTGLEML